MQLTRTNRAALLLTVGSLALSACGASSEGPPQARADGALSGALAGAGSSAQGSAMEGWIAGFQGRHPDVTVTYDPVGSGGGREQFLAGGVAFGGSDAALDADELTRAEQRCGTGGLTEVPLYISPIAVAFNLPGVDSLRMSAPTIAGVFAQKITRWDAPEIAADNPGTELPDMAVTPVNRADTSGTTENFVEYLAAAAPEVWTFETDGDWPVAGGEAGQGTSGVVQAVTAVEGAVGYADASQVGGLGTVAVGVGDDFVDYSPEAAAAVVEISPRAAGRPEGSLAIDLARDTTASGSYPIVLVSYQLACSAYDDPAQAELVKAFLTYVASEDGQRAAQDAAGSAPISDVLRDSALARIEAISGR